MVQTTMVIKLTKQTLIFIKIDKVWRTIVCSIVFFNKASDGIATFFIDQALKPTENGVYFANYCKLVKVSGDRISL